MDNNRKTVIALGFFDGVHLGHQALMQQALERARQLDMQATVFTFDRSPREFVTGQAVPLLTTAEERCRLIDQLFGIRDVIVAPFDHEMMTMPWEDFIHLLVDKYHAGALVAGHDYRFGHKNIGTAALLAEKAAQLGLVCDIIPPVTLQGTLVSATHIRTLLEQGDMDTARAFLGHPFTLSGSILHGAGLGRQIGAPTVNLVPPEGQLLPPHGVYATRVLVDGEPLPAVTNVGMRPTLDDKRGLTVESHILDRSLHLYGQTCRVEFLHMMRPERRFGSLEELQAQIALDVAQTREYFQNTEQAL